MDSATVQNTAGAVDTWVDKSGSGFNATSLTTARPTTATRTINGKNVIEFNGSSQFMTLLTGPFALGTGNNTLIIVYNTDNNASRQRLFSGRTSTVAVGNSVTFGQGSTGPSRNYVGLVGKALNLTPTNSGISGTPLQNTNNNLGSPYTNNGRDRYVFATTGANKKNAVICAYGLNDLGFQSQTNFQIPGGLTAFTTQYQQMITGWLAAGYTADDITLCSPNWVSGYNYGGDFTGSNSTIHAQFVSAVQTLAQTNGCWYAPTFEYIRDNGGAALLSDLIHPNDAGYVVFKNAILAKYKP